MSLREVSEPSFVLSYWTCEFCEFQKLVILLISPPQHVIGASLYAVYECGPPLVPSKVELSPVST